jgi:hypothetical protein
MSTGRAHYSGDVHWIDHSIHSGPNSTKTMKYPHYALVLTGNNLLMNKNCPLVSYVPMTSFKRDKHWNFDKNELIYPQDVLIRTSQYKELEMDTIIDCGQIFTCDIECFNDFRFHLNTNDLKEVRKRIAYTLGFG